MPLNKHTPGGSFYSLASGAVKHPASLHGSTPRLDTNNEFKLPAKLKKLPKDITDTAKKHAEKLREPVILKDMFIYRQPEYLTSQ